GGGGGGGSRRPDEGLDRVRGSAATRTSSRKKRTRWKWVAAALTAALVAVILVAGLVVVLDDGDASARLVAFLGVRGGDGDNGDDNGNDNGDNRGDVGSEGAADLPQSPQEVAANLTASPWEVDQQFLMDSPASASAPGVGPSPISAKPTEAPMQATLATNASLSIDPENLAPTGPAYSPSTVTTDSRSHLFPPRRAQRSRGLRALYLSLRACPRSARPPSLQRCATPSAFIFRSAIPSDASHSSSFRFARRAPRTHRRGVPPALPRDRRRSARRPSLPR
ncbi:hypothetical protein ACHAWF_007215, partial [Thalassiosira exigua]